MSKHPIIASAFALVLVLAASAQAGYESDMPAFAGA